MRAASVRNAPTISVVVPVYRAARYLAAAVDSILAQTFADFELILVFDHSDDGTEEILECYARADSRVRVIENSSKKQLAAALNVGLAAALGRFIARMDADDIASPTRFAAQIEFLEQHPDIALCGTAADIIDREGRVVGHFSPSTGTERVRIAAEYAPPLFHPTWMMRHELARSLGGYRDMSHAEDYDFQLRALDAGFKLDNLPIIGLTYRRDPSHRARIVSHKAANYGYAMHRRRQRGLSDGFSAETFKATIAPASWSAAEKLGQGWVEKGFAMIDQRNPFAPLVLGAGLLLVPASAYLTWRRLKTAIALRLYGLTHGGIYDARRRG
jgi:glycosyltransferase involved in cell wall biosynthesis